MTKVILSGSASHMGKEVISFCENSCDIQIVAGISRNPDSSLPFPVYSDINEYKGEADVMVDFSNPLKLEMILDFAESRKIPLVLCTTGYSKADEEKIAATAEKVAVLKSSNMSLGVNLMLKLCKNAASVLGADYDIEIVEKHHRRKIDSPSGTAIMLADKISESLSDEAEYIYDRHSRRAARGKNEIGIQSLRGGNIVGEHSVIFCGDEEILELKHSALSRRVFARGAIEAAKFISSVTKPGLYNMDDLISNKIGL